MDEQKTKALIVEDEPTIYELLKTQLADDGFDVVGIASTGKDAVKLAREKRPDIIIMDINLESRHDGIQASRDIQVFSSAPIVYLSSEIEQAAINTMPYGYVLKPFKYKQLKIAIDLAFHRHELEQKLISRQAHLNQSQKLGNMGSWELDIVSNELIWTDQIFRIFGTEPQSFVPTYPSFMERIHPDDRQAVLDAFDDAIKHHNVYDIEHRILRSDGQIFYVHETGEVTFDNEGKPVRMIGTIMDITEAKQTEQKIVQLAYYDPLTGLPNRTLLLDRLDIMLATAKRNHNMFSVMFIDLDGFKEVNDTYGHKAGDRLLQLLARRVSEIIRGDDTIARIGGDEFIALVNSTEDDYASTIVARKILNAIEKPYEIFSGINVNISASIGVALYPDDGSNADELLTNSDNAMYAAKVNGKNNVIYFEQGNGLSTKP